MEGADGDGFELSETYWGTQQQRHRWTVFPDGQLLTVESTYDRPCPPCGPGVIRIVRESCCDSAEFVRPGCGLKPETV